MSDRMKKRRRRSVPEALPRKSLEVVMVFPDPIGTAQPTPSTDQEAPAAKTGKKRFPKRCVFRFDGIHE